MVEVRVANIGPRERARRLRGGVFLGALTVGCAGLLIAVGAPRLFRLALLVPFFGAGAGVFQFLEKT